jgi:hypothetical protein
VLRFLQVALAWLLLCVSSSAQTLGTITGEVKDPTGAVLPGATVTVVNKATNAARTASSNGVGLFDVPALPPGTYTVRTELDGFKTAMRDVELQVQQTARVDFTLELGTVAEAMTVTGVSPIVETQNATIGTVIENRRIVELPLNGRNYLQLVALSPNVSADFATAGQAGTRQGGTRANQQLSVSGQRREFNNYTLDGVNNTDVNFNTYIFLPSVDALEEFKVQTGVYSAEFGREAQPSQRRHQVGDQQLPRDTLRVSPRRQTGRETVGVHRQSGGRAQAALSLESVRLHSGWPRLAEPPVLHVELRRLQGSEAVPDAVQRAVGGDARRRFLGAVDQPRDRQCADRPAQRRGRRSGQMLGRRHGAVMCAVCQQRHSRRADRSDCQEAARVLSRA